MSKECIAYLDSEGAWHPVAHEELVRCKDCKHWQYESCFVDSYEWDDAESIISDRFAFDFCSRAERKEE